MQFALIAIGILNIYLLIDIGRLFKGRINKEYLRHAWVKTALWLVGLQVGVVILTFIASAWHLTILNGLYLIAIGQLLFSVIILISALDNFKRARTPISKKFLPPKDLPTVTVCIPARNETLDLQECLESLIASTYPKLEIIVLDDSSQDRRTPEIIRGFAHDGVRFLAGVASADDWLPKNYAYKQLADTANGEILMFCGVDSRFEPGTISNLISLQTESAKSMISVLPKNMLKPGPNIGQNYIQPTRYAWELALPRQLTDRPPVLSTCWLIKRESLDSAGGFDAIKQKSMPESYFAKNLSKLNDGYQLIISNSHVGLRSNKSIVEQKATAIRTRYPQLHRRPELVALVGMGLLAQMIWPFILFISSLIYGHYALAFITGLASLFNIYVYSQIVNLTYRRFVFSGLFSLPIAVIYDLYLLNYSMWQYEFGEVIWKDRNISTPIMQVTGGLPKA